MTIDSGLSIKIVRYDWFDLASLLVCFYSDLVLLPASLKQAAQLMLYFNIIIDAA
ncbi:MAG: hypothetical protein ACXWT1_07830 [Methylobacter sp.]